MKSRFIIGRKKSEHLRDIALKISKEYQALGYQKLSEKVGTTETQSSGKESENDFYQVEVIIHYDNFKEGNIRVIVAVDDGSFFLSMMPPSEDFIITPENKIL